MELFKLLGKIVIDKGTSEEDIDKLNKKAKDLGEKFEKVGTGFKNAGDKIQGAGKKLMPVTTIIGGIGIASSKMAINFEDSIANINTLLDDKDHLEGYKDTVKRISNDTGLAIDTMASGMYQAISSLGDGGKETEKIFGTMATAAKAGGAEVSDSVALISAGMKGYNQVNDETAKKISDLAFQTAKLGVTTFPEMAKSMQPLFPLANSLALSYEELFGSMATLTGVTGNTAEVSTQLKAVFSNLMTPTKGMQKLLDKYGYSSGQAMLETEGLAGMLGIVQKETGGQADKMAELFSSVEAVTAMTALTGSQFDTFNDKLSQMGDATGATETAYSKLETKGNTLRKTWNRLKNTGLELGETLTTSLAPMFEKFSGGVQKLSEWFISLDENQQQTIIKIAVFAAALGPALIMIGKVSSGIGSIISVAGKAAPMLGTLGAKIGSMGGITGVLGSAVGKLGGALGALASPVGIVVAAIAVLTGAFLHLWNTNEDFKNSIVSIWDGIVEKFNNAGQKITDAINSLGFDFNSLGEAIKAAWDWICNALAPVIVGIFDTIGQTLGGIIDVVTGIVQVICGIIKGFKDGDWSLFLEGMETLFTGFIELITAPFHAAFETFKGYLGQFGSSWEEVWIGIKDFFSGIWESITGTLSSVWEGLISVVSSAWETIKNVVQVGVMLIAELLQLAFDLITLPFRFIWENCKETIVAAWESIKEAVSNALDAVKSIIETVWNAIVSFLTPVLEGIKNIFSTVFNAIKNVVTTVFNAIVNVITAQINFVKNIVTTVLNAVKTVFATTFDAVKTKVTSVINGIKTTISSGLNAAKTTVTNVLTGIKNKFSNIFDSAKNIVKGAIDKIKGYFNFQWSLPKLKLPHFSINGSFSLNPPSVPSFGIEWYKNGAVLQNPTLFGYNPFTGNSMGGGEAGDEAVAPVDVLLGYIRQAVAEQNNVLASILTKILDKLDEFKPNGDGDIIIPIYFGSELWDEIIIKAKSNVTLRSGGMVDV